eukprot:scaffold109143_cov45-Phaeocystis_antarctica.AAC.1
MSSRPATLTAWSARGLGAGPLILSILDQHQLSRSRACTFAHVHGEVPARAGPSVAADDEDLLLGLAVL